MNKIQGQFQMRHMLPVLVFFFVAIITSLGMLRTVTGPAVYSTSMQLHTSANNWLSMVAKPEYLSAYFAKSLTTPDAVISAFTFEQPAEVFVGTKIDQVSLLLKEHMKSVERRGANSIGITINHSEPTIVRNFIAPYLNFLHQNYFETWLANFEAAANSARDMAFPPSGDIVLDSNLPVGSKIEITTQQALLKGSAIVSAAEQTSELRLSFWIITLIAFLAGLAAATATHLAITYKTSIWRLLFDQDDQINSHRRAPA